jgi:nucleotide-binding universal stress UspA family protein
MGKRKPAVVLPLDGSKTATSALGAAQAVTEILGGVLHIVHIAGSQIPEEQLKEHLQISGMDLRSCLIEQITGEPAEAILAFASKVDAKMIVMASHGFTYNDTRLIGGITMGVIQEAKSPVMIIRSDMEISLIVIGDRPGCFVHSMDHQWPRLKCSRYLILPSFLVLRLIFSM